MKWLVVVPEERKVLPAWMDYKKSSSSFCARLQLLQSQTRTRVSAFASVAVWGCCFGRRRHNVLYLHRHLIIFSEKFAPTRSSYSRVKKPTPRWKSCAVFSLLFFWRKKGNAETSKSSVEIMYLYSCVLSFDRQDNNWVERIASQRPTIQWGSDQSSFPYIYTVVPPFRSSEFQKQQDEVSHTSTVQWNCPLKKRVHLSKSVPPYFWIPLVLCIKAIKTRMKTHTDYAVSMIIFFSHIIA